MAASKRLPYRSYYYYYYYVTFPRARWILCYITNEGCVVSTILTQIIFGIQERARWRLYECLW